MKKLFAILFLLAIITGSCTKEYHNPTTVDNGNNNNGGGGNGGGGNGGGGGGGGGGNGISPVPSTFTQKVLIEEFTGEWCGFCPDGLLELENAENSAPGKVYGASCHNGDPFTLSPFDQDFETTFPPTGYPTAMVNRVPQGSAVTLDRPWTGAAAMQLANTAVCGLAMSSYTVGSDSLYVEVHCGFNTTLAGDYRLTIYLLEDDVPAVHQSNYYDDGSYGPGPLVGIGNPITTWAHNDVIREVLTGEFGDAIPASKMIPGGEYVIKYGGTITGFVKNNLKITAFINKIGTSSTTHQVMNVQQAKVAEIKDWD
ncbi:MAG TPA: Omp28-related outer membrane protein [Chitinophagales bacterium]|nr:Omp28-related outer membrane protein [Chitinophagales bacterium]